MTNITSQYKRMHEELECCRCKTGGFLKEIILLGEEDLKERFRLEDIDHDAEYYYIECDVCTNRWVAKVTKDDIQIVAAGEVSGMNTCNRLLPYDDIGDCMYIPDTCPIRNEDE